MLFLK